MAVQIPFPLPSKGFALNSKVRVNLDYIVSKFNEFNTGTATWDNVFIGTPNNATGALTFYNSSNPNYIQFNAGATSANLSFTLPIAYPVSPAVLMSTAAGVESWSVSPTLSGLSVGNTGVITVGRIDLYTSARFLNGSGFATSFIPNAATAADLTFTLPPTLGNADDILSVNGSGVMAWTTGPANKALSNLVSVAINTALLPSADNVRDLGSASFNWRDVFVKGSLLLQQTGAGTARIAIQAPAAVTDHALVLPGTQGGAGTVLVNNGAGVLSWGANGGANTTLSNLGTTAINATLLPDTRDTYDFGSSTKPWGDLFATGVVVSDYLTPYKSVTIKAPVLAADYTLTLPVDAGTNTYLLQTNGFGVTSWVSLTSAGGANNTLSNLSDTVAINKNLNNFSAGTITASLTGAASLNVLKTGDTMTGALQINEHNLVFLAALGGYKQIAIPNDGISWTMTLPSNHGTTGQVLVDSDGAGTLGWGASPVNSALSNLTATSINVDLVPNANNSLNLGSTSNYFLNVFGFAFSTYKAGSFKAYPTTASKGSLIMYATDSAGDTITYLTNASQAAARTYTIPDAGASASFVMTEGNQTVNGVKTLGNPLLLSGGDSSNAGLAFSGDPDTGIYLSTSNFMKFCAGGVPGIFETNTYVSAVLPFSAKGTTTNDSAAAGYIGEYIVSSSGIVNSSGNSQFFDVTSITLSVGDWDISGIVALNSNGATFTSIDIEYGISTSSGNAYADQATGNNSGIMVDSLPLTFTWLTGVIPSYRVSIASGTPTYYLKAFFTTYTAGTPRARGRISARRVR